MTDDEIYKLQAEEFDRELETGEWDAYWKARDDLQSQLSEVWEHWAISRYGTIREAHNAIGRGNNHTVDYD